MRIAIFCNGRSGSTSLFNYINCCFLQQRKQYNLFFEPFNYINPNREDKEKTIDNIINKENIILKTFIDRDNYPIKSFSNFDDYLIWVYSFFDKIIVLERKNKRLQAESLVYHIKLSKNRTVSPHWHKPKYYDLTEVDEQNVLDLTKHLESESIFLKSISERGYPLYYFEDLFVDKDFDIIKSLNDYCGINHNKKCVDEWITSSYKKVRIEQKPNSLI